MAASAKDYICPHCQGWGAEHIPVKGNFTACKTCGGISVAVNTEERKLYWGDKGFTDSMPFFLRGNFCKANACAVLLPS